MEKIRKIGVLTSGGDAPGMNAAIRAITDKALEQGIEVVGVIGGYRGLIDDKLMPLTTEFVNGIVGLGGTRLYSDRCDEFKTEEGMQEAMANCKKHGIEGIVVIGGDGSFRGARDLSLRGVPCVGVPGTIDNDIASTEYTIGFDTAMNTAMEMVDKLRDTAQSHDRCSVVEVMGRRAGFLALQCGIAVGATAILVPEVEFDLDDIITKIEESKKTGKKHFIIVVAEGVGGVEEMAKQIEAKTDIETRATILGHVQRGGRPTVRDRVYATRFGYAAVQLLNKGIGNRVVGMNHGVIVDYDIYEALNMEKPFDTEMFEVANTTSI